VLTDEDIAALTVAMQIGMSPEEHAEHHATFRTWIDRENRKAELREKVKAQIGGWGIVTALSGIGYAVWEGTKQILHVNGGR
jgi:hypothetical protein